MAVYKYNLIAGCYIKNTSIYNNLFFIYTILLYILLGITVLVIYNYITNAFPKEYRYNTFIYLAVILHL